MVLKNASKNTVRMRNNYANMTGDAFLLSSIVMIDVTPLNHAGRIASKKLNAPMLRTISSVSLTTNVSDRANTLCVKLRLLWLFSHPMNASMNIVPNKPKPVEKIKVV